jgi:hypothetical protein
VGKRFPGFKANHAVAKKRCREITHTCSTVRGERMQWRSALLAHVATIAMLVGVLAPQAHAQTPVGAYVDAVGGAISEVSGKLAVIYDLGSAIEDAGKLVQDMAAFLNQQAQYPFDTVDSRLARILEQEFILVDMAQVVQKNAGNGAIGLGIYLEAISIIDAAAIALGQQQQYIISHNALPPIDPWVVDHRTITALENASTFAQAVGQQLQYPVDRIFAGAIQVSGGTLNVETSLLILGGEATDPDNVRGQANISAKLVTGSIQAAGTLAFCHGASLSGTGTIQANTTQLCGGTVTPGFSVGHILFDGDLVVEDGLLEIEVGGAAPGQFDMVDVTGAAHFQGGKIRFVFTDGFVPTANDAIEFLTAHGGISFEPALTTLEFVDTGSGSTFVVVPSAQGLALQRQAAVTDTIPPAITVAANPAALWPPNGKLVSVTVSGTITDNRAGDSGVDTSSAAYTVMDEYGQVQPHGSVTLSTDGRYNVTVALAASRNGNDQDGRRYTITVNAKDKAGNLGGASTIVTVPHDQGK